MKIAGRTRRVTYLRHRFTRLLVIIVLTFFAASAIRVHYLNESPMLAEVQFRGALIARAKYFGMTDSIPDWRREVNAYSTQRLPVKEPSIMESLVSLMYWVLGREDLRVAGLLSAVFWVSGGILLFRLAKRVISTDAAMFATAYYLFVPVGIHVSVGFLADPLMIMMFLASLLAIVRYYEKPKRPRLLAAAGLSALAILVKPLCAFAILGAFASSEILKSAKWKDVFSVETLSFLGICSVPVVLYYLYEILITKDLAGQAQVSFLPQLLLGREYWKGWLLTANAAVGTAPLVAALLGIPMLRKGLPRTLLIGLWIGYAVFGLVFSYHIRFASHYHLQLVVIVALSLGPLADLIAKRLRQCVDKWYWWLPAFGALLLVALFGFRELRSELAVYNDYESERTAQEIGEIVGHSSRTVYVASYYGRPLEYYGELSGTYWPRRASDTERSLGGSALHERSVGERLSELDFSPEYVVITDFGEYKNHHADLRDFLAENCVLVAESDRYLIYKVDSRQCTR